MQQLPCLLCQIPDKNIQGRPEVLNYDNGYPYGKIRLWYVPNTNYTLFLLSEKELTQFTLDDDVIMPPGWEDALIYNLSLRLSPLYGQPLSAEIVELAKQSKGSIMLAVMKNRTMDAQPSSAGGYNIFSGRVI